MNTLTSYLEQYALLSLEKLEKLAGLLGDHTYELDLDEGNIKLNDLEIPFQVLGTESENTLTWLWAWADEQTEVPEPLMASARRLRAWGEEQGLEAFTAPSVDLDTADGRMLTLIGAEICKASAFYRDHYEGGSLYLLLFDNRIDQLPPFDLTRLSDQFLELIADYDLNHRNTLLSYLKAKNLSPLEGGHRIACTLQSGELLTAEFDNEGKLTVLNGEKVEG